MTPRHRTIRYARRSCHRGREETTRARGEREKRREGGRGGRQRVLWRDDATQLRPSYSRRSRLRASGEASERKRNREKEKEKERVWTRGLLTRNEPITPRDRCYLFIILLNVEAPRPVDRSSSTAIVPKYSSGLMSARGWIALDPFDSTEETLLLTFATDKTSTLYVNSLMGSEFIIVFPLEQPEFTTSSNPYI